MVEDTVKLPTVTQWTAGNQPDADMFNDMSYALTFAMNPPQAWVVKTGTAQAIPAATWTTVQFSSIVLDTGAAAGDAPVWTSGDNTKLYLWTPGWYDIEANLEWASNTDGTRRLFGVAHMGQIKWRTDILAKGNMKQRVSGTWFVNAGEYLQAHCWTNTAQSLAADQGQNSLRTGIRVRWFSL